MYSNTFAELHAKRLYPDDLLDQIEMERKILDVFDKIKSKGFMSFEDYQEICYLKIPFLNMLAEYKKIEHHIALELIKRDYVTYDNLLSILEVGIKKE